MEVEKRIWLQTRKIWVQSHFCSSHVWEKPLIYSLIYLFNSSTRRKKIFSLDTFLKCLNLATATCSITDHFFYFSILLAVTTILIPSYCYALNCNGHNNAPNPKQRCSHLNPRNLWIFYLIWKGDFADMMKTKDVGMGRLFWSFSLSNLIT